MSLRKSSKSRNGSKSDVLPNPNARRKCTPAPSSVGLDLIRRFTGRMDMEASSKDAVYSNESGRAKSWDGLPVLELFTGGVPDLSRGADRWRTARHSRSQVHSSAGGVFLCRQKGAQSPSIFGNQ